MLNTKFNSAVVNMGYRYMGVNSTGETVWGKPFGCIILELRVTPDLKNVIVSTLIKICVNDNIVPGVYASYDLLNYMGCESLSDLTIEGITYEGWCRFIAVAEMKTESGRAIEATMNHFDNMAFKTNMDPMTMICTEY